MSWLISYWYLEIDQNGSIYTMETGKGPKITDLIFREPVVKFLPVLY